MTIVRTGRRMKSSEKFTRRPLAIAAGAGSTVLSIVTGVVGELVLAGGDHRSPAFEPLDDLDQALAAAGVDEDLLDCERRLVGLAVGFRLALGSGLAFACVPRTGPLGRGVGSTT